MIPGMQPTQRKTEQMKEAIARPDVPVGVGRVAGENGAGVPPVRGVATVRRQEGQTMFELALAVS